MNLEDLNKLTFASADPVQMDLDIVATVEGFLNRKLERADPLRLFLRGVELIICQLRLLIDECAKQNLLYYATGDNLEHLGILVGVGRLPAAPATTTLQLNLSTVRDKATIIPAGTRVSAGDKLYFATDENVVFAAGETQHTVTATCSELGEIGNNYAVGEINKIIDPTAFLSSITNLTVSEGGSDIETDDSLRKRIRIAPESFSVSGPSGAYEYWAKTASPLISDVYVDSENPGEVDVYVLEEDGVVPDKEMLNLVYETCNDKMIRPLTDLVVVKPPTVYSYDIELRYWIARSDQTRAGAIQVAAEQAIEEYMAWQRAKLGRDISPTELIYRLRAAGVKRVELIEPKFLAIPAHSVALTERLDAIFAGLEDD